MIGRNLVYIVLSSENTIKNSIHWQILKEIEPEFNKIYILCLGKKYIKQEEKFRFISGNIFNWISSIPELNNISLIYGNDNFIGGYFATWLKLLKRKPLVVRIGSPWIYELNDFKSIIKTVVIKYTKRKVLKKSTKIIYNSKAIVDRKIKHKYEVVYNGVDTKLFRPMPEIQTKSDRLRLIAIGNINKEKGLEYLFEAIKDLKDKVSLTVVGDGPLLKEFKEKNKDVTFIGRVEHKELPRIINQHDVLVHPSYVESFPNVILEAMACGKPVIACNVYGIPEMVTDGYNGFLVRPKNIIAIKEILIKFNDKKKLFAAIRTDAQKKVHEQFQKEKQIHKLYNALFDSMSRPLK